MLRKAEKDQNSTIQMRKNESAPQTNTFELEAITTIRRHLRGLLLVGELHRGRRLLHLHSRVPPPIGAPPIPPIREKFTSELPEI